MRVLRWLTVEAASDVAAMRKLRLYRLRENAFL
jgi:hypothetical protein